MQRKLIGISQRYHLSQHDMLLSLFIRIDLSSIPGVNSHYLHPPFTDSEFVLAGIHWRFSPVPHVLSSALLSPPRHSEIVLDVALLSDDALRISFTFSSIKARNSLRPVSRRMSCYNRPHLSRVQFVEKRRRPPWSFFFFYC